MDSIKDLELMQLDVGIYLQSELVIQTFSKLIFGIATPLCLPAGK